jgi:Arc/MetJ-type ribon-helix-helix transcriptional regulator
MAELIPSRYASQNSSTFFDVAGLLITIEYAVTSKKAFFVLPGTNLARLYARVGDSAPKITHQYEIPRSHWVGSEIAHVERGLYGFMDEVVRTAVQLKALESAERQVEAAEAEHLFFEGTIRRQSELEDIADGVPHRAAAQADLLTELVGRVITAVRHLTNVTSLSREGLEAYQRDRSHALERVTQSKSFSSALRVHDILQAVEAFLRFEAEGTTEVQALRERTLDYLDLLERRQPENAAALTHEQAHIIVNEFVPAFVKMRTKYEATAAYPKNIVEHAFGSFFGGGIAGWFTLSVLGEKVLEGLTGVSIDIPGFYIGAAVSFTWPYARAAFGFLVRERQYERRRRALLEKTRRRLKLALPKEG